MESAADTIFLLHHYLQSSKVQAYPMEKRGRGTLFQNAQIAALVCWIHERETKEPKAEAPVLDKSKPQQIGRGIKPF